VGLLKSVHLYRTLAVIRRWLSLSEIHRFFTSFASNRQLVLTATDWDAKLHNVWGLITCW